MKINVAQLRGMIREEISRIRETRHSGSKVPRTEHEFKQMVVRAARPDSNAYARLQRADMSRLWNNVYAEMQDGTPYEEVSLTYLQDWLLDRDYDKSDVDDILNNF